MTFAGFDVGAAAAVRVADFPCGCAGAEVAAPIQKPANSVATRRARDLGASPAAIIFASLASAAGAPYVYDYIFPARASRKAASAVICVREGESDNDADE
jgi:hypothetical protein